MNWPALKRLSFILGIFCPIQYVMGVDSYTSSCNALTLLQDITTAVHISDGLGRYVPSTSCVWTFQPNSVNQPRFRLLYSETEEFFDFVKVYDGDQVNDTNLLATYTGQVTVQPDIVSTTGALTVTLTSDTTYCYEGFEGVFFTDPNDPDLTTVCPGNGTLAGGICDGHGTCTNATCVCDPGFTSSGCFNADEYRLWVIANETDPDQPYAGWSTPAAPAANAYDWCNTFSGISCYMYRITVVSLSNVGVSKLPRSPFPFYIELIDFSGNGIVDSIPSTWLTETEHAYLSIYLQDNMLYGPLPNKFSEFLPMGILNVRNNSISGSLYSNIWRNTALTDLDLRDNHFTGFLHPSMYYLSPDTVQLTGNAFWCPLPQWQSITEESRNACINLTLTQVTPSIGKSSGFNIHVTAQGLTPLVDNYMCGVSGTSPVQAALVQEGDSIYLSCNLSASVAGVNELAVMTQNSDGTFEVASLNSLNIWLQPTCPPGTYLEEPYDSTCQLCPSGAQCQDNLAVAAAGFISSMKQNGSFIECAYSAGCQGGTSFYDQRACAPHYTDFMCSKCESNYYLVLNQADTAQSYCQECPDGAKVVMLRLALVAVLSVLIFYVEFSVTRGQSASGGLIMYELTQTAVLFTSEYPLPWNGVIEHVKGPLEGLHILALDLDFAIVECSFGLTSFFAKFALYLAAPIFLAIGFVLIYLARCSLYYWRTSKPKSTKISIMAQTPVIKIDATEIEREDKNEKSKQLDTDYTEYEKYANHAVDAYLHMLVLLHVPLTVQVRSFFACEQNLDRNYLMAEPSITCFEGTHADWLPWAVLALIVYVIGIPFVILFIVLKNRKSLYTSDRIMDRYGALYQAFAPGRAYWWEFIRRVRAALLVMIALIFRSSGGKTAYVAMALLVCQGVLIIYKKPYFYMRNNKFNMVAEMWLVALLVSVLVSQANSDEAFNILMESVLTVSAICVAFFGFHCMSQEFIYYHGPSWRQKYALTRWLFDQHFMTLLFDCDASYEKDLQVMGKLQTAVLQQQQQETHISLNVLSDQAKSQPLHESNSFRDLQHRVEQGSLANGLNPEMTKAVGSRIDMTSFVAQSIIDLNNNPRRTSLGTGDARTMRRMSLSSAASAQLNNNPPGRRSFDANSNSIRKSSSVSAEAEGLRISAKLDEEVEK